MICRDIFPFPQGGFPTFDVNFWEVYMVIPPSVLAGECGQLGARKLRSLDDSLFFSWVNTPWNINMEPKLEVLMMTFLLNLVMFRFQPFIFQGEYVELSKQFSTDKNTAVAISWATFWLPFMGEQSDVSYWGNLTGPPGFAAFRNSGWISNLETHVFYWSKMIGLKGFQV